MADLHELLNKIESVIAPVIQANNLELVDVEVAGANYLRIRVGKPDSMITLDECADISRKIEEALDMSEAIADKYILEVSSPGINRPLKKAEDFIRFTGRQVKVITREKINDTHLITGILEGIRDGKVLVKSGDTVTEVPLEIIKKAHIDEEDLFLKNTPPVNGGPRGEQHE